MVIVIFFVYRYIVTLYDVTCFTFLEVLSIFIVPWGENIINQIQKELRFSSNFECTHKKPAATSSSGDSLQEICLSIVTACL